MLGDQETIVAISTAKGVGALSIVRISGPQTPIVLKRAFSASPTWESHHAYHGFWCEPETKKVIDEVLVLYFSPGKGFTGEEAAEVICHGGIEITNLILKSILNAGARLARPGEFTYRAVMNNKMDLPQAESVLEIIQARTPQAAALALKNIRGALSDKLSAFEKELVFILANLEASIDFTTEDIQPVSYKEILGRLTPIFNGVQDLLKTYLPSRIVKQGLRVVFAGKPNGGKSSLLNALLGVPRSIVDHVPGTTRDTIEAEISFDDQFFCLVDTAGLRNTDSFVETQGVLRTRDEIKSADIVVYVIDCSRGLSNEDVEVIKGIEKKQVLICFNKRDLLIGAAPTLSHFGIDEYKVIFTETISSNGTATLKEALAKLGQGCGVGGEVDSVISTERQHEGLKIAIQSLLEARASLEENNSPDLISFSLREALCAIQNILGKNASDDIMERVFKEFCIGK